VGAKRSEKEKKKTELRWKIALDRNKKGANGKCFAKKVSREIERSGVGQNATIS